MEAILTNNNFSSGPSFNEVAAAFFKRHSPDSANLLFWKVFQCWALKDCTVKAEVTDQEIALFFDQLTELVAAAYIVHQSDRANDNPAKGKDHE